MTMHAWALRIATDTGLINPDKLFLGNEGTWVSVGRAYRLAANLVRQGYIEKGEPDARVTFADKENSDRGIAFDFEDDYMPTLVRITFWDEQSP